MLVNQSLVFKILRHDHDVKMITAAGHVAHGNARAGQHRQNHLLHFLWRDHELQYIIELNMRRLLPISILLITVFFAPVVALASENQKAQDFLKQLIEKKTKVAEIHHTNSPSTHGKDYLRHEEALELVSQHRLEEASKLYEEIVLDNPNDDEAYVLLGHTYLLSGKYGKAETAFATATDIQPENTKEILSFYENLTLQDPDNDKNYALLGYVRWMMKDSIGAKEAFGEALRINPENSEAQSGLDELRKNH